MGKRAHAIAVEAAEQSERLSVPEIRKPAALDKLIKDWPKDRALIVCAEHGVATPVKEAFCFETIESRAGRDHHRTGRWIYGG